MTKFKWLFMLVYLAMLAALVLAYGWGAAILGAFGSMYFGAFVLTDREGEE